MRSTFSLAIVVSSLALLALFSDPARPNRAIASANRPPRVSADVDPAYCRGDYVLIRVRGIDPDGDSLSYRVGSSGAGLPDGLALGRKSGRIRGVLRRTGDEGSSTGYDVEIVATDAAGLSGRVTISIFSIACEEPRISLFTLIDAGRDESVRTLVDGAVLSLGALPKQLNIRADAYPTTEDESFYGSVVESVRFVLDGVDVRTENTSPYALAGDANGDYASLVLTPGPHTLTAIPYDADGASGNQGVAKTIHFEVVS